MCAAVSAKQRSEALCKEDLEREKQHDDASQGKALVLCRLFHQNFWLIFFFHHQFYSAELS